MMMMMIMRKLSKKQNIAEKKLISPATMTKRLLSNVNGCCKQINWMLRRVNWHIITEVSKYCTVSETSIAV